MMIVEVERRKKAWSRIIGVERRAAPMSELDGHPLPDPTKLEDEDFLAAEAEREAARKKAAARQGGEKDEADWFD